MLPACKEIETTLDGYALGWKNIYTKEAIKHALEYDNSIIYADSFSEAAEKLREIGWGMNE